MEEGNASWLVPEKFLALSQPSVECDCCQSKKRHLLKIAKKLRRELKIDSVVRLNRANYNEEVSVTYNRV